VGPLSGDAARLQQVVWNLLSNAVKFTPKGGRVDIRVGSLDSQAQITVSDTGQGIAPAFLPHLFERFCQADSSATRTETGLGIGLAIVRHLVELHGGTVEAQSPGLGKGATFTVRLPLPAIRMAAARGETHATFRSRLPPVTLPALNGVRVLVVDDDADARQAVQIVLEQCEASVVLASSVREAMETLAAERPDVVVSDIAMPHEDGYDLIRHLRGRDNGDVPAIALTAYGAMEEGARLVEAGYQVHLTKPVAPTELAAAIASLVGRAGSP
jgi:CheY-like chemotaxis protein